MSEVDEAVRNAVANQLELSGEPVDSIDESTVLLGPESVVDSLGLVTIIIDIEQSLLNDLGVAIILVDEKAMSERNSPFRTVGSLTAYASSLVGETQRS